MTGFARQDGVTSFNKNSCNWYFELKSVNGKSLDIKTKLPSNFDFLASNFKNTVAKYFSRGNISLYLEMNFSGSKEKVKINDELLSQLIDKAKQIYISDKDNFKKPSASEILAIKGVVEIEESHLSDEEIETLQRDILAGFEAGCKSLQKDRQAEGEKIKIALLDIMIKIAKIVKKIGHIAETLPKKLKKRLAQHLDELTNSDYKISEERIAQEICLYVARADIREEIDRLKAHIETAYGLLEADDAVGRRLDFLCQELNREANTTCSKSSDIELTNLGMELKTLIEQFREQVQNME